MLNKIPFITFLSSSTILRRCYRERKKNELEIIVYGEFREENKFLPDYIYKNYQKKEIDSFNVRKLLNDSFKNLTDYLEFRGDKIYVKDGELENWQVSILKVSPLQILSYFIYLRDLQKDDSEDIIPKVFKSSVLPSIFNKKLENFIERNGLIETHLHINGTTEGDFVWQDALKKPELFSSYIKKSISEKTVHEQYFDLDKEMKITDLPEYLQMARRLREVLVESIYAFSNCGDLKDDGLDHLKDAFHPICFYERKFKNSIHKTHRSLNCESLFLVECFKYMNLRDSKVFAEKFHHYILIYNFFLKILIQQKNQVGFDQFQKITMNQLRELTEENYLKRFIQLEGMYGEDLKHLEARFSPKDDPKKMVDLLEKIIGGFVEYKNNNEKCLCDKFDKEEKQEIGKKEKKLELFLIAHFVKLPDKRKAKDIISFRDLALRIDVTRRAEILMALMDQRSEYREYIKGFDAAANELHASPEVFAPTFRFIRSKGYINFTYHAGEDFIDLVSGIRMIYEAVDFLDFESGNRIGHGTAVGIDPILWQKRVGRGVVIEQGEYLDNLVFSYEILKNENIETATSSKIKEEISRLFEKIYGEEFFINDVNILVEAWKLRKLDPCFFLDWKEESGCKYSFYKKESTLVEEAREKYSSKAFKILKAYHSSKKVLENYKYTIEVKTDFFTPEELTKMQIATIKFLNKRGIIIESIPSSNVRISFYKEYKEHHIFRWLGIKKEEGFELPTVCLASDDPGIFNNSMRIEFSHLYEQMKYSFNLPEDEIFRYLEILQRNNEVYKF